MANGCGIVGFTVNFDQFGLYGFEKCCNQHDLCYSTCRSLKKKCDYELFNCLNKKCSNEDCYTLVDFLFYLVCDFGCKIFLISQKKECVC